MLILRYVLQKASQWIVLPQLDWIKKAMLDFFDFSHVVRFFFKIMVPLFIQGSTFSYA